jgi:hypothetical protein
MMIQRQMDGVLHLMMNNRCWMKWKEMKEDQWEGEEWELLIREGRFQVGDVDFSV